jgi:hypothetical protein
MSLPGPLHDNALSASALLVERMRAHGHPSTFQLGRPIAGPRDGVCEPHVSLFMLRLDGREVAALRAAVAGVAASVPAFRAEGREWRHNSQGAPELHFQQSHEWIAVQRAVVSAVEPLRRGTLRDTDPSGANLAAVVETLRRDDPAGDRLSQLTRYGYDEISDDTASRFHPHVTVAWPRDAFRASLQGSPPSDRSAALMADAGVAL